MQDQRSYRDKANYLIGKKYVKNDTEIARIIGLHKSTVSSYLSGNINPSNDFIKLFEEKFGKYFEGPSIEVSKNPDSENYRDKYFQLLEKYNKILEEKLSSFEQKEIPPDAESNKGLDVERVKKLE